MTSTLTRPSRSGPTLPARAVEEPGGASPAPRARRQLAWLAAGLALAFAVPFLLADTLDLDRDLYYGLYALAVGTFVAAWWRDSGFTRADLLRRWPWGVGLGLAAGALLVLVVRGEPATPRADGLELAGQVLWRGVLYGATDGVLLSVFPVLAVFAALAGTRMRARRGGVVAVGALALAASLAMTAVYHLGYSDFRSSKLRKPLAGDLVWSAPTLLTLSPLGAPIAHVGLHVSAVLHSPATDTFLPPHRGAARPELEAVLDELVGGPARVAPGAAAYVSGPNGSWSGAAGLADLGGTPMPADARMRLESVSKIWTAALVLRLAQDGALRPTDTVERWLPGLLPYGERLTVAQLLTHTSGLIDNNDMASDPARYIARVRDRALAARLTAVARRVAADPPAEYPPELWIRLAAWQPLLAEPGTTYHYSNIGFELLGLIAARASGETIPELYRANIFEPFGLASAAYDPQGPITGPHASGYTLAAGRDPVDATAAHGGIGAEGGVVANAADTARFLTSLMRGEILEPSWVERLRTGLFWRGGEGGPCGQAYGHSGAGAGFKANVLVSAEGGRVAVLLLNGRRDAAADARAGQAVWRLFCAA